MVTPIYKYTIEQLRFPVDGYTHYVMTWVSVDGGETYYHCGQSQYFKSEKEACEFIELIESL